MVAIFTYIVGLLMCFEPITDPDFFMHMVLGKWISNNGIPTNELFSWFGTQNHLPWVSHEWLTELIMYKIGPLGCVIAMLLIFLGLYILLTKMLKINMKKLLDIKYAWLLLMAVFFKVTGPRPYIISLLFFAYLIYILFNYLDKTKPIFKKLIWTIPILQILWVNLHGGSSSLPYIFLIGVIASNWFLKILPHKEDRWGALLDKEQIKTLFKVLIATLLTSLINPQTYEILLYPFTNMLDGTMTSVIIEWQSPNFQGMLGLYVFIMIAFPLFNMIFSKTKYKLYEVLFLLLFLFMCLKSQRFVGMYGIYSTWLIGKYCFLTDTFYEKLKEKFKKYEKAIKYVFIIGLVCMTIGVAFIQIRKFDKVMDNHGYYSDTAIKKVIELEPKRLYNDFGQGGYLLYKLDEYNGTKKAPLFIYGLGDVFSPNILTDATDLARLTNQDPATIIAKYDFDVILTVKGYLLHDYMNERDDYKLYYEDDMCYIYVKIAE